LNPNRQDLQDFYLSKLIRSLWLACRVVLLTSTQATLNIRLHATQMLHHLHSNQLEITLSLALMIAAGRCTILKITSCLPKCKLIHLSSQFNSTQMD